LSTGFRSSPDAEHPAPLEPLERQQATLLAALREARGAPVSYAELRRRGIEFPATIVSELALLGVPVERCHGHGNRPRRAVAVRLDPALDHRAVLSESQPDHAAVLACAPRADTRPLEPLPPTVAGRATTRVLLAAIALAAVTLVALLLVAPGAGTRGAGGRPAEQRTRSSLAVAANTHGASVERSARASTQTQTQTHAQPQPETQPQTLNKPQAQPQPQTQVQVAPVSATLATQLEARGHELLNAGRYAGAVPVLRRALSATGESLRGCVRPASEQCLTYAYALYDLGRALLLGGSPVAAVGVLEHRLRIENQQPVVAAELASARRRLG
jgi:hypothetical protein